MAIHKLNDGFFVASSNGAWIAGVYDCQSTARYAFQFPDFELSKLQAEKNKTDYAVITKKDLQELRKLRV